MVGKYKVVTLCGSTKFKDEFMRVQKDLTLKGIIVISVGVFGHSGDNDVLTEGTKTMLDDMHKRKIDMADAILIINKNDYIGRSTRSELEYAIYQGKEIYFLEKSKDRHYEVICPYCGSKTFVTRNLGNLTWRIAFNRGQCEHCKKYFALRYEASDDSMLAFTGAVVEKINEVVGEHNNGK